MSKRRILIQLDTDPQPSVFDAVVAVDSNVDFLFRHHGVTAANVRDLVYGAIFTRGPADLNNTGLFIGGSDVAAGEAVFGEVQKHFMGPLRVSVLMDSNGSNTTAAAAVRCLSQQRVLAETGVLVLGASGPVGQRVVRLLARAGARVRVASRSTERAEQVCQTVSSAVPDAQLEPCGADSPEQRRAALAGMQGVIAAGAPGVELLDEAAWQSADELAVAIDLNAVAPAGIAGIEVFDHAETRHDVVCFGAIGTGGLKMKIHKQAIARLFASNDQILDAEQVYEIAESIK